MDTALLTSALLPLTDPVSIFAAALVVFLVVPLVFERFRVPGILGLVIVGAVIGPNGLGVLERDATFELMGRVGLLYIFFMAALEVDLREFAKNRRNSLVFGLMSFLLPQVVGALGSRWLFGFGWPTAILLGSMFGSHTLLAYPVAAKLGIGRSRIVTTGLGGTIVTDAFAVMVLAIVAAGARGTMGWGFWAVLLPSVLVYVGLIFTAVPLMARWFFRRARAGGVAEFLFLAVVVYGCAALAPLAQLQPIIGAFLAGFAVNRFVPHSGPLMNRVGFLGHSLFIPFFLVSTGMLVDARLLVSNPGALGIAGFMVAAVLGAKFLAAYLARRVFGYTRDEMMVLFGLTVPQAAATLAAVFVGVEIGLFGPEILNGAILMILATCLAGPLAIQRSGEAVARAEADPGAAGADAPQRLLVPLANPHTARELIGLALMMRDPRANEPLLPITVVPDESQVARSEKLLVEAVVSAAEADVQALPLTRIDRNPASGILRAAGEKRASDIVIGWNGAASVRLSVFGGVIDQVLEQSTQQVSVARILHPIAASRRVAVVLPSAAIYHPGFVYGIRSIKRLCAEIGGEVHLLAVGSGTNDVAKALERAGFDIEFTEEDLADWGGVAGRLGGMLTREDLAVLLTPRRNAIGHSNAMDRLPAALAAMDFTFLVVHPSATRRGGGTGGAGTLPDFLSARNILFNPPDETYSELVGELVATEFPRDSAPWRMAVDRLVNDEFAIALLRESRMILAHARVHGVGQAKLLLAIRPDGILHPGSEVRTHVMGLVLFPHDYPGQQHLDMLARTAQFFSNHERVEALRGVESLDALLAWVEDDGPGA